MSLPRPGRKTQTRFFWCSLPSTFYICAHPTRYMSTNKEKKMASSQISRIFQTAKAPADQAQEIQTRAQINGKVRN